eukprot:scaffold1018_cov420-Prasinococcus_capsulatus_cf.AAC.6
MMMCGERSVSAPSRFPQRVPALRRRGRHACTHRARADGPRPHASPGLARAREWPALTEPARAAPGALLEAPFHRRQRNDEASVLVLARRNRSLAPAARPPWVQPPAVTKRLGRAKMRATCWHPLGGHAHLR